MGVDLLAEVTYVNAKRLRVFRVLRAPDLLKDHPGSQDTISVLSQIRQDLSLIHI